MPELTPKRVATAIGVSESSLKRWCDKGLIQTTVTPGGHRRLSLDSVLAFLRESQHPIVQPELLGLPPTAGGGERSVGRAREELLHAFQAGDAAACRQVLFNLFLAGQPISRIGDEMIAPLMRELGEQWSRHELDPYQERRACEICLRTLHELRRALPTPTPEVPLAIGGTPEGDPYALANTLAELVLTQCGWRAQTLGIGLPFTSLARAIEEQRPGLFWLSVSAVHDEDRFVQEYEEFFARIGGVTPVVVGGRAMRGELRRRLKYAAFCDTLQQLELFAATARKTV